MAALSAVVFTLSWWLGLYLLARDPRKPVLVLAAVGLTSFASVVALDAVRIVSGLHALIAVVAALAFFGAAMAGNVDGPMRMGHWVLFGVISLSSLGALLWAVFGS